MKVHIVFLWLLSLLLFPNLSLACRCLQPTLEYALYNTPDSIIISGRIIDKLKLTIPTPEDGSGNIFYAYKVNKIHRAPCSIQEGDTIIVSTSASSASCGLDLNTPNTRYFFSASIVEAESGDLLLPTAVQVSVNSCAFYNEGELSYTDKQVLRQYKKKNNPTVVRDCSPPTPCKTGAECDQNLEYCDAIKNQCVVLNETPCPCLPTPCAGPPCENAEICKEATDSNWTCLESFCCGCTAIFVDEFRTQICNTPSLS